MTAKKNKGRNRINTRKRLAILFLVIGLLLIICIGRAVYLVMQKGSEYEHRALVQATGTSVSIPSQPGNIYGANGTILASTYKVYRLILDPKVLYATEKNYPGSFDKTVEIAAKAFSISETELEEAFGKDPATTVTYVRFRTKTRREDGTEKLVDTILSQEQVDYYGELTEEFQKEKKEWNETHEDDRIRARIAGVWFEEEYRREYPLGSLLSKVIGYTTRDTENGILGLEVSYEDVLHGTDGRKYTYINEEGNAQTDVIPAQDGNSIVTSLDANVAAICRDAINKFMEETGAERVNVLVMDPNTGEVLAMESNTPFDLNNPTESILSMFTEEELADPTQIFLLKEAFKGRMDRLQAMSHEEQIQALIQQVQYNYCISGAFEPGSTAKSLTLATGIEEGIIDRDSTFEDWTGGIGVGRYTIHCHMGTTCGVLTPMEALGRSCNVCYVEIGQKIGAETFSRYQEIFNLGQKTGIDLPGEADTSALIYYKDGLGDIELATCSFGQGFNVSMIQLASAYCSLVNGGYYYQPHVVTEIVDSSGNVVKKIDPVLVRRTVSSETSEYIQEALRYVTTHGTANTLAPKEGYEMGGKTGAAEKLPRGTGKYIVSFVSAAPINDPKVLLYVTIDEPNIEDQSSSAPAQQLAHDCWDGLYTYFGIFPETEENPYEYDWSSLRDSTGDSELAGGESFIDDPENTIVWLTIDEEPVITETPAEEEEYMPLEGSVPEKNPSY